MHFKKWFIVLLIFTTQWVNAKDAQHVVWDKTPIRIMLPLNQERLIRFPQAISIVDSELDAKTGVMKIQDALYINAHEAYFSKRLVVQLMPEGETIVLMLTAAEEAADATPIEVVIENPEVAQADEKESAEASAAPLNPGINPVSLTRFAIQSLYSPARLLVNPEGVSRTPMLTHRTVTLVSGASVMARPLVSWKGADVYVTAVELKNLLNKEVIVEPNANLNRKAALAHASILGNWQTASFFPTNTLGPRGKNDTTTVFLTSDKPFGEALNDSQGFVR
ncbi:MAG: TIGR03749 family integrating conjugative element protein [Tatlockia sp.]|nr:TIGR03749 family integrating conjugative element protein [Tatlockia sp.]